MLSIRGAQQQAFDEAGKAQFVTKAIRHLHAMFPDELAAIEAEELNATLAKALAKARGYGLSFHADLIRYLEYVVFLGENFDTAPHSAWAGAALQAPGLTGEQRMDAIDCEVQRRFGALPATR